MLHPLSPDRESQIPKALSRLFPLQIGGCWEKGTPGSYDEREISRKCNDGPVINALVTVGLSGVPTPSRGEGMGRQGVNSAQRTLKQSRCRCPCGSSFPCRK